MSIFKVLEGNIEKSVENFSKYLRNKTEDVLKGTEFMFYSLSSIFKDKEIDELEIGIVDASYRQEKYDFGIDAIYITASNDFLEQPEEIENYSEDTKFKIHLFQFKRGPGISQADLLKFNAGIQKALIDENLKDSDNLYFYNRMIVLNQIKNDLFEKFSVKNISVYCHIVFGGIEENLLNESILNEQLNKTEDQLKNGGFTNMKIVITDCQKLITAPSKSEEIIDVIEYQNTFKYITDTEDKKKLNGYISIICGKDIAELVRKYQSSIFEANIRDYYKKVDLNSRIIETSSSSKEAKFFWSFNNGLTMTCNKVEEMPNRKYKLHNLQIVNGCQTSNAIYIALKNKERVQELENKLNNGKRLSIREDEELERKKKLQFNEQTSVLVKIIETNDEDLIYRITETTNSQTPIKAFSLKANDDIQKFIEKYLENAGVNYERRINELRNKGKKNIYSIQKLFQLYTSQILLKPSQVRTNPKQMFTTTYEDVFPDPSVKNHNYVLYLIPIRIDMALNDEINNYLTKSIDIDDYQKTLLTYGKLHLGCLLLSSILKGNYSEKGIVQNEVQIIQALETDLESHFKNAVENLRKMISKVAGNRKESIPSAVKKKELDNLIVRFIKNRK